MILAFNIDDLPADAIGVLILLLLSLASWIKSRFFDKKEEEAAPPVEEDPMREVIWRRQTEGPPKLERRAPVSPPMPPPMPPREKAPPGFDQAARILSREAPEVSARQAELAREFEHRAGSLGRRSRRSPHRRRVEALLRSPMAAREAVVIREVLGPPLALRSGHDEFSEIS